VTVSRRRPEPATAPLGRNEKKECPASCGASD
jgi:hypothetical protein